MRTSPPRVLLRGGRVWSPTKPDATALLTVGGTIAWVGADGDAPADQADEIVELDGRLVTPGFVDAHVHLSRTGLALQTLDLGSAHSLAEALDLLATAAAATTDDGGGLLLAHGWDESGWPEARTPSAAEVDRAVGHRLLYASRIDGHSGVVSSALVAAAPAIAAADGWRGDGVVERDAHHRVREAVDQLLTDADRERAILLALRRAAETGLTSVHEVNAPHIAPYDDRALVDRLRATTPLPEVVHYWGAHCGGDHPDDEATAGFAGDLCIDGALGSRTAALQAPYADSDGRGHLYLDDIAVRDHVVWCTERGMQAGFHVTGDLGGETAATGLRMAAEKLGAERIRAARHRLEHIEMPSPETIGVLAALGVVASVQPAFDAAWGGPGGMYEQRLGAERAAPMNPFASMARAGVVLAFGSDGPVTPMDPWAGVRAAVHHHNPDERLTPSAAVAAHTRGGHRARGDDSTGVLAEGARADYAVWAAGPLESGLPVLDDGAAGPVCERTVSAGVVVFAAEGSR